MQTPRNRRISPTAVRHVRNAVRVAVRIEIRSNTGLCGMCGIKRARTHKDIHSNAPHEIKALCARKDAAHTAHTAQPSVYATSTFSPYRTPIHTYRTELEKEEEVELTQPITCTADNVTEFNATLREHLPEARALIKALMERGMVEGLRGCAIGPLGTLPVGVEPVLSMEAEKRIQASKAERS